MAISDRITSIEEHIKESYQELEGIGIDTTGVNNNLENIPKLIDGYWETLPKVTGEGTSITLDNTKEGKMKINLKGNTSQAQTTQGKNLFTNIVYKDNYVISSTGGESYTTLGCIWDKIKVEPSTTYTLSYTSTDYTFSQRVSEYNSSDAFIQRSITSTSPYTFTTTSTTEYINLSGLKTDTNIQIEKGSTATIYEPFVPNSPSPDYPQNIHVVSGDNIINVCGKNLFDKSKDIVEGYTFGNNNTYISASDFFYQSYYIPVKPNTTYSFLGQKTTGTDSLRVCEYKSDKEFIKRNYELYTITTTQDTRYIRVSNYKTKLDTTQVEISSTSTTYEPYQSASYPINLGDIELCKIGDYQDSIVKDNGKWYLNKRTKKGTLNGTEDWRHVRNDTGRTIFSLTIDNVSTNVQYLSNMFIYDDLSTLNRMSIVYNDKKVYVSMDNLILGIENSDTNSTRVQKFKTWLGNNPLEICRIAGTPTYTEIIDSTLISQLNALAKSYEGQTNISQENNDLASILNATALEEME